MALLSRHQSVTEGVSWMELAFDCELATHTQFLHHPRSGKKVTGTTSGRDRARYFASATRQLFKMCGGPRLPSLKVSSLQAFGGRETAGLPVRPMLCHPRHLFAELAHQSMMHRKELFSRGDSSQWSWPPYYKRPPKPSWISAAVPPSIAPRLRLRNKQTVNHDTNKSSDVLHDFFDAAGGVQSQRGVRTMTTVGSTTGGG